MTINQKSYRDLLILNIPNSDNNIVLTPFTTLRRTRIGINDYITRILSYSYCSEAAYIISLIYLNRILMLYGETYYNHYSFHRFYITSLLVATKYIDDNYLNNKFYANLGGINVAEIYQLELKFLEYLRYDLYVSEDDYNKISDRLILHS